MIENNGWPGKPGVPRHPEKDGWHWLQAKYYDDPVGPFMAFFWNADQQTWPKIQPYGGRTFHYLGPVLTPDEASALQARVAELGEALRQTVLLFKEILDAIDADPAETKLTLRKQGVAVESITAAECFDKAATLLEGKKDE